MKVIKLKNNPNIRDIGGKYKDVTLKENMLLRGRTFLNLSDEQKNILKDKYHLKTIIDLRSHDEAEYDVEQIIDGVNYEIIPIFEREKGGISHKQDEKVDEFQVYRQLPTMDRIYLGMLHGQSLKNMGLVIGRIIDAKDDDFAIYFHCSEGKDRTGLIAAILLLILGVSRKEIIKDYMFTNKMANKKAFKYYMKIKYVQFDPRFALKVGRTFLAKKKYIETLFNIIDNEYDSLDNFLKEGLNLNLKEVESFKEKIVVK